jgi:hypothetical protein
MKPKRTREELVELFRPETPRYSDGILGSFTMNVVFPSAEDSDTKPPWARTICRTMNKPKPRLVRSVSASR